MSERVISGSGGGLLTLAAADALWADLTADSAVPTASAAFTRSPANASAGYVLLGGRVVATVKGSGARWCVPQSDVRRAAAELDAVDVDRQDLVRVGPFRGGSKPEHGGGPSLRWRQRIAWELRDPGTPQLSPLPASRGNLEGSRVHHLAGIDWRQMLVERTHDRTARTWWLPRAVVKVLDAAEHTETKWLQTTTRLQTARSQQGCAAAAELPSHRRHAQTLNGHQTMSPDSRTAPPRPYNGELEGHLYSTLSRKNGISDKVAAWACAVCRTAPATVLDHCHEHGYVRAPLCQSCNTRERPDHLYRNDVRVGNHYTHLFHTHAEHWLRHWHRCPGCRARTTLPLPHLAALTAHLTGQLLRPTHRTPHSSRGRKPCGMLRASWKGSQNAPGSCMITIAVDFCPSGEHRILAQVSYREATARFHAWLTTTAPDVAAAAGPSPLDGIHAPFRPVIADSTGEGLQLF